MDLDRQEEFGKLDYTGLLRNIEELPSQVETVYQDMQKFALPAHFIQAKNILLLGTGFNYFANFLVEQMAVEAKIPIKVWNNEGLPNFVDSHTLVIANSYTGDDLGVVNSFSQAGQRGAKLLGITTGGMIASLCRKYRNPCYEIIYGSAPRAAIGFPVTVTYMTLQKIAVIETGPEDIRDAISLLKGLQQKIRSEHATSKNIAKQISQRITSRKIIICAAKHLFPVAIRFTQQLIQTSKVQSFNYNLSELDAVNYLRFDYPNKNREKITLPILKSKHYGVKINEKIEIIESEQKREGVAIEPIEIETTTNLFDEALQATLLVDYISYYLAINNNTIPEKVDL